MLSVVIPTLNEEGYLGNLLKDLKDQTYQDFEVIVADSFSEDRTAEIAEEHGCKVIKCSRKGPGHGRNRAASEVEGENILFLDADVRLENKYFLEEMMERIQRKNINLATFPFRLIKGMKIENLFSGFLMKCVDKFNHIFSLSPGFCTLISREIHEKIGGYRENIILAEDHEYIKRASEFSDLKVLDGLTVETSTRRQEKEGRIQLYKKYIHCWLHRLMNSEMDSAVLEYSFGTY